jgi:hypothetical protein
MNVFLLFLKSSECPRTRFSSPQLQQSSSEKHIFSIKSVISFYQNSEKNVKSCFLRSRTRQEEIHDVIQAGREDRKK